jgi:hypothetical protein
MAKTALPKVDQDTFYATKLKTANFYFKRLLPQTVSLLESIKSGSEETMAMEAAEF